jgi:hypothetical protein
MIGFKRAIAIVVFTTIIEGLAIWVNILAHPEHQPLITIFITAMATLTNGFTMWYYWHKNS